MTALGFGNRQISRQFLIEGLLISIPGSIAGMTLGYFYGKGILQGLGSIWRGAVGQFDMVWHIRIESFIFGAVGATAISLAAIWFLLRYYRKPDIISLLNGSLNNDKND